MKHSNIYCRNSKSSGGAIIGISVALVLYKCLQTQMLANQLQPVVAISAGKIGDPGAFSLLSYLKQEKAQSRGELIVSCGILSELPVEGGLNLFILTC